VATTLACSIRSRSSSACWAASRSRSDWSSNRHLVGAVGDLPDAGQPLQELGEAVASKEQAEGTHVLDLVEHSDLGAEGRLAVLEVLLRLVQLVGEDRLLGDERVELSLVLAQPRVVLEQLGVERGDDLPVARDLGLGVADLVLDRDLL